MPDEPLPTTNFDSPPAAPRGFQLSARPLVGANAAPSVAVSLESEFSGALPRSYGSQSIHALPYDPQQLFVYWDIDWGAVLRDPEHRDSMIGLRVFSADGGEESRAEIDPFGDSSYVRVDQPGGTYYVELGSTGTLGSWSVIARSQPVTMPSDAVAEDSEAEFASLPLHLSFQRLLETFRPALSEGESLAEAAARIQREVSDPASDGLSIGEQLQRLTAARSAENADPAELEAAARDLGLFWSAVLEQWRDLHTGSSSLSAIWNELGAFTGSSTSFPNRAPSSWSSAPSAAISRRNLLAFLRADVLVHGATDPAAAVWIAGERVVVQEDGTFHQRFAFADGGSEVAVIVRSPDGVAEYSATLKLEKQTARAF